MHATKKRKQTIIILFLSTVSILNVFFLTAISGQLLVKTNMYSYGSIQIQTAGITAYRDSSCNTRVSGVAWGTIAPGSFETQIVYIKNDGSSPLTLSLDTTNWNPTNAPGYMDLTWNYDGQTIDPNEVLPVALTLSVDSGISGINSFNFEIVINGTS
ncbi:MAG: hypothetical protein NWF06_02725 [Candidatus Bathyarchaeota archaeon]|nr:hypothetical protein [Candidatus Bathyarchaeum sp.]